MLWIAPHCTLTYCPSKNSAVNDNMRMADGMQQHSHNWGEVISELTIVFSCTHLVEIGVMMLTSFAVTKQC